MTIQPIEPGFITALRAGASSESAIDSPVNPARNRSTRRARSPCARGHSLQRLAGQLGEEQIGGGRFRHVASMTGQKWRVCTLGHEEKRNARPTRRALSRMARVGGSTEKYR